MIRSIIERTGVKIDVEDDGRSTWLGRRELGQEGDRHHHGADRDRRAQQDLHGQVQRITDFGAFVEIIPAPTGSCTSRDRTPPGADVRDELNEGDQLLVKVISIDPSGKIRLSRKRCWRGRGGESAAAGDAPQSRPSTPPGARPHGHDRGPGGSRGGAAGGRGAGPPPVAGSAPGRGAVESRRAPTPPCVSFQRTGMAVPESGPASVRVDDDSGRRRRLLRRAPLPRIRRVRHRVDAKRYAFLPAGVRGGPN